MEFKYPQTRDDILDLLIDLAGPWEDPMSLSGFGTPFQNKISQFSDITEAIKAVDMALVQWAIAVDLLGSSTKGPEK